jgi:hypothetical protein
MMREAFYIPLASWLVEGGKPRCHRRYSDPLAALRRGAGLNTFHRCVRDAMADDNTLEVTLEEENSHEDLNWDMPTDKQIDQIVDADNQGGKRGDGSYLIGYCTVICAVGAAVGLALAVVTIMQSAVESSAAVDRDSDPPPDTSSHFF